MKKMYLFVVMVIVGALLLAACASPALPSGGGAPAPSGGTTKPAATSKASTGSTQPNQAAPTSETGAGNTQPNQAAPTPKPTSSSSAGTTDNGTVDLQNVTEGLAALDSYKAAFTMTFDGKDDSGNPQKSNITFEEEYQKNPLAKRTKFSGLGSNLTTPTALADNAFEIIEIGGKTYASFGSTCAASSSQETPTSMGSFSPSGIIGDVKGSQLLGTDTVNGVSAKHYNLDLSSIIALGSYSDAKGEAWIADPGNYVVKYTFSATGQNSLFGGSANATGLLQWDYEVTSINQPVNIVAPQNCGGAADDIPTMADATGKSSLGGVSTYTTVSAFNDVVNFYKKEMPNKGWTANEDGVSAENFATLSFTKDTRTASVTISFDQDKKATTVVITDQPN